MMSVGESLSFINCQTLPPAWHSRFAPGAQREEEPAEPRPAAAAKAAGQGTASSFSWETPKRRNK